MADNNNNIENNLAEQQNESLEQNKPVEEGVINLLSRDSSPDPAIDAINGYSHPLEEPDVTLRLSPPGEHGYSLTRSLEMNEGAPLPPKDFLSLAPPCLFPPARTWIERLMQPQQEQQQQPGQSLNMMVNLHPRVHMGVNMLGDRVIRLDPPQLQQHNWPMAVPFPMFPQQQMISFAPTQQQGLFPQMVNVPPMRRLDGWMCKLTAVVDIGLASQAHGLAQDQPLFPAPTGIIYFGPKGKSDLIPTGSVAATEMGRYLPRTGNHPWLQETSSQNALAGEGGTSEETTSSSRSLKRKRDEVLVHDHIQHQQNTVPVIEPARNEENAERADDGILMEDAAPNDEGSALNPVTETIEHADGENSDYSKDNVEGSDPPSPSAN